MPPRRSAQSVAPGGWIVLGLLIQDAPQSGYDLASRATRGIAHFWPITKAQVYAELPRLEAAGFVDSELVEQDGAPDKRLYRPTPAGRRAFAAWFAEVDLGDPRLRHPLLIRLWFGDADSAAHVLVACADHQVKAQAQRTEFEALLDRLTELPVRSERDRRAVAHRRLVLRHGILRLDAELRWLREVEEFLAST